LESVEMTLPFASAYAGRSVFVTGHTGFKGSWLALWLAELGAKVTGYSTPPPTTPSNFDASRIREVLVNHCVADIRDRATLTETIRSAAPEVIFHLAAQSLVRESYRNPYETFEINVQGTAALLEAVRSLGRPCAVVVVASDKCYEPRTQSQDYAESDPLGGFDPYSASKGAAEIVTASYRRSFFPVEQIGRHGVRLASARAGNVIGGGDWAIDRIIPDMVSALSGQRPVPVRNPDAVRPWQHVLEPVSGYLLLAARLLTQPRPELCSAWNFGPKPGRTVPVRQLVESFLKHWGTGSWDDRRDPSAPYEMPLLGLSIEKAIRQLNWTPRWSTEKGIERTARWYLRHLKDAGSARQACLEDIREFSTATGDAIA
jgi:CDP-glucose 4,6-dehydratase